MATSTSWMDESEYRWMLERSARTIVMRRNLSKLQRFCTWMLCAFVGQRIRISGRVGWGYDGYRYSTLQGLEIPLDRVRFNICCFFNNMNKSMASRVSFTDEVFMEQPPGFEDFLTPDYVCKLHKPIYGLRQAPRAWYNELRTFLVSEGFSI
ncbi:UNVERIFIED_CONTAM: Retrovirus-related Pol polyprotein from transposon RE2 [Sesamum latifolium]|uniref:Retrovirus-related Pol polyprotein from transposon RE2 n=1 Tax=Sesamum latifolium TaxID=2727402 RepID=A0AAW2SHL8_9LAMI